ncbi:hypothetical protein FDB39_17335 [Clostridium botulinum]|nr:hypothetical protein [Clostridium botulinum]
MIKNVNDGEIDQLKKGFNNTMLLKKINMLGGNNFMSKNLNMSLSNAIKIYKNIYKLTFIPDCYKTCSYIMINYLVKYNLLDKNKLKQITDIFFDDSSNEEPDNNMYNDEFYSDYGDFRYSYILYFLKHICSEYQINVHVESYRDILFGESEYINLKIFGDIRKELEFGIENINELRNYSECYLDEEYINTFEYNANVYVLENYEIKKCDLILLRNTVNNLHNNIYPDIYTNNGNTYIILPDIYVYYELGYSFLVMLKLIFLKSN